MHCTDSNTCHRLTVRNTAATGSIFKFDTFDFLNLSYFLMGEIVSQTDRRTSCAANV